MAQPHNAAPSQRVFDTYGLVMASNLRWFVLLTGGLFPHPHFLANFLVPGRNSGLCEIEDSLNQQEA
jgi:hypothetical protein